MNTGTPNFKSGNASVELEVNLGVDLDDVTSTSTSTRTGNMAVEKPRPPVRLVKSQVKAGANREAAVARFRARLEARKMTDRNGGDDGDNDGDGYGDGGVVDGDISRAKRNDKAATKAAEAKAREEKQRREQQQQQQQEASEKQKQKQKEQEVFKPEKKAKEVRVAAVQREELASPMNEQTRVVVEQLRSATASRNIKALDKAMEQAVALNGFNPGQSEVFTAALKVMMEVSSVSL